MSVFNKAKRSTTAPDTVNNAGGQAHKQSDKLHAISLVLTSFVKDTFYRTAGQDLATLKELAEKVDPEFLAKLAVYARTKFGMRSITHALAGYLAPKLSGKTYAKSFYDKVVHRVDDMSEILSVIKSETAKCVPNAVRKGFKKAFERFDAYQLAKYRSENKDIKLVDIVNLVHPKHTDALQKLIKGELKNEETWEARISSAGQNKENPEAKDSEWIALVLQKSLGYMALIRNLRNLEGILEKNRGSEFEKTLLEQITNEEAIRKSLILPFQIGTAYDVVTNTHLKSAVGKAMDIALANVPKLPGETLIFLDTSGSMSGQPINIASLFAAVLAKTNEAKIIGFQDNAYEFSYNKDSLILDIRTQILRDMKSGGTNFHAPFQLATTKDYRADRIIILSDMQAWAGGYNTPVADFKEYKRKTGKNPFIYSFDLNGSGTMQFPENQVFAIAGFHQEILKIMGVLEQDKEALIKEIENITL